MTCKPLNPRAPLFAVLSSPLPNPETKNAPQVWNHGAEHPNGVQAEEIPGTEATTYVQWPRHQMAEENIQNTREGTNIRNSQDPVATGAIIDITGPMANLRILQRPAVIRDFENHSQEHADTSGDSERRSTWWREGQGLFAIYHINEHIKAARVFARLFYPSQKADHTASIKNQIFWTTFGYNINRQISWKLSKNEVKFLKFILYHMLTNVAVSEKIKETLNEYANDVLFDSLQSKFDQQTPRSHETMLKGLLLPQDYHIVRGDENTISNPPLQIRMVDFLEETEINPSPLLNAPLSRFVSENGGTGSVPLTARTSRHLYHQYSIYSKYLTARDTRAIKDELLSIRERYTSEQLKWFEMMSSLRILDNLTDREMIEDWEKRFRCKMPENWIKLMNMLSFDKSMRKKYLG